MSALLRGVWGSTGLRRVNRRAGNALAIASAPATMLAVVGLPFAARAAPDIIPDASGASRLGFRILVILGVAAAMVLLVLVGFLFSLAGRVRAFHQLREAVNVMPDGLVVWDSTDHLLAWNDRFTEISETDMSKLHLGMPVREFLQMIVATDPTVESGDRDAWVRQRTIARRQPGAMFERQTRSGRWLRIENRPTVGGSLVVVSRDVTDFKLNAEQLTGARDEAEAANRAKTEFLASVSHEIRTPMNGVIGMNALLLRTQLSPEQRKFAEGVRDSADEMMAIVNNILDLARLEAGKVVLEEDDLGLAALIGDVVDSLRPQALEKSLDVSTSADAGVGGALRGDPDRLRQVLFNLVSNAVKFTERGRIWVEATSRAESDRRIVIRIAVHDTGIGFKPSEKRRLFQNFQQADGSITRRYGGAGIGLSISRQLVELMGGRIGADNRPGGGSTFWFEVTLNAAAKAKSESGGEA
jgi:signal transduction histidine kinase